MGRSRTPSFITDIPLITSASDERVLLARLEAGRQMYNACLGEGLRRVNLVKQSKLYQLAKSLPKTLNGKPNPERSKAFAEAWQFYNFRDYEMQAFAGQLRPSWLGEHIDADTAQKLGTRAFKASRNRLLGRSKRVRFKGANQMDSLEGKSVRSPMKWQDETFLWKGLRLQPLIDQNDPVILHGLNSPVKYVRLVRRKVNGQNRFYVQLINEAKHSLSQSISKCLMLSWDSISVLQRLRLLAMRRPTFKRSVLSCKTHQTKLLDFNAKCPAASERAILIALSLTVVICRSPVKSAANGNKAKRLRGSVKSNARVGIVRCNAVKPRSSAS